MYLICTLPVQVHYKQIRMTRYIDNVEQPWTKMNNDFGENSTNDAQVTYYVLLLTHDRICQHCGKECVSQKKEHKVLLSQMCKPCFISKFVQFHTPSKSGKCENMAQNRPDYVKIIPKIARIMWKLLSLQ